MKDKLNKSLALSLSTVAVLSLASTSLMADVTASLWVDNFGANQSWSVDKHPRMMADVDGDEKADVVGFGNSGVRVSLSSDLEFEDPSVWVENFGYDQSWRTETHPRMMADVDGDEKPDVVGFGSKGIMVSLSTGTEFSKSSFWVKNFGSNQNWSVEKHVRMMADVDGDGQADAVGFGSKGVMVSLSSGSDFDDPSFWIKNFGTNQNWSVEKHPRMMADVDGDGLADVVGFGNQGVMVALSTGSGFLKPSLWVENFGANQNWSIDNHPRMMADINGDGKADVVGFGNQGVSVAFSTGSHFSEPSLVVKNLGYNQGWRTETHPRMTADVDDDGKADIVGFGNKGVMVALTADINVPPVARAGADQTVPVNTVVQLDGSGSTDDGEALTYDWNITIRPTGSTTAALSDKTDPTPTFTPDETGTYIVALTVTDVYGKSDTDDVNITAVIMHNGTAYLTVTNPDTGEVWLDRNLGASQVCAESNDTACYGDYYQWGRNYDGHEKNDSVVTTELATSIDPVQAAVLGEFIIGNNDWLEAGDGGGDLREGNLSKTDGTYVCPAGFRVPTIDELTDEMNSWGDGNPADNADSNATTAFESPLHWPVAGSRKIDGSREDVDYIGYVWSSTPDPDPQAHVLWFHSTDGDTGPLERAYGVPVRCIKHVEP